MVNAWSLAASILNGTFDEDYPIMKKKKLMKRQDCGQNQNHIMVMKMTVLIMK